MSEVVEEILAGELIKERNSMMLVNEEAASVRALNRRDLAWNVYKKEAVNQKPEIYISEKRGGDY